MSRFGGWRTRRAVSRDGFAIVDLFTPDEVASVRSAVDAFPLDDHHGFFVTIAHAWGEPARQFDLNLRPVVGPAVDRSLPGLQPFLIALTSKGRNSDTPIKFHQDWTYVDERNSAVLFLWSPLVDVDESNGALHVCPGSHRWTDGLRAARSLEATEFLQNEFAARSVPVPLRAGQAVVFHPATVHGSGTNSTPQLRPAITVAVTAPDAEFVHFHLADDGVVTGFHVPEEFFSMNPYGTPPEGCEPLEPWKKVVAEDDFVATMGIPRPEH